MPGKGKAGRQGSDPRGFQPLVAKTWEEFYAGVEGLIEELDRAGHRNEAARLRDGMHRNFGLTDGQAELLEAIADVQKSAASFTPDQRQKLDRIHDTMYFAVHRSKRRWWRFWTE